MKKSHRKQFSKELIILLLGASFGIFGGAVANILHALVYDDNFFRTFPLWVKLIYAVVVFGFLFGFLFYLNWAIKRLSR